MRRTTFTKDENNNCFFNCIKQSYDNFANIGTLNPISSIGLIQKEEKICQTKTKRKLQHSTATSLKRMNSRATVVFKTKEQFLKSMQRTMASRIHSSLWTTVTQSWALAVWRSKISLRWWSKARWKRLSPKTSSDSGRNYIEIGKYTELIFPRLDVRYIAINDNFDSLYSEGNELAPFKNLFNEW